MLTGILSEFSLEKLRPVVFLCNAKGVIQAYEGALSFYSWTNSSCSGKPVTDLMPALWGADLESAQYLPFIELENGQTVGIQIKPQSTGQTAVIVFDQNEEKKSHQQIQQIAKKEILLNEKLTSSAAVLQSKNEELDKAYQAKNEFIASVSHELRTPLSSIIGYADSLKIETAGNASAVVSAGLDAIRQNAHHLLALLENILEQGRLTAETLELSPEYIDATNFFTGIKSTFRPIAENKNLSFSLNPSFEHGTALYFDEHYLRLVLVNLLGNALKYTEKGGVSLSVEKQGKSLVIEISDTGIGIEEKELKNLFKPFKRGNNIKGVSGVGLGLNIVNEIIGAMKGEIRIDSTPGVGTKVSLTLPEPEPVRAAAAEALDTSENLRVLLVEDDPDLVSLYKLFISRSGMEPIVTQEFLNIPDEIGHKRPDVIVLDYNLGETNGIDILSELRLCCPDIPAIMFTATTGINDSLREKATMLGCRAFLYKPRDMAKLSRVIREVTSDARKRTDA